MIRDVLPGSGCRIFIFYPPLIQGVKRHRIPDPQHWVYACLDGVNRIEVGAQLEHHLLEEAGRVALQGEQRRLVTVHTHLLCQPNRTHVLKLNMESAIHF